MATLASCDHPNVVKILDTEGFPVPDGEPGRIFVGNGMLFEGTFTETDDAFRARCYAALGRYAVGSVPYIRIAY